MNLDVYQTSMSLVKEIYYVTGSFPNAELYGITSQMRRAAVSILANISEGAGRRSSKEDIQFLYISLGSTTELSTLVEVAFVVGFLKEEPIELQKKINRVKSMLLGLIKKKKRQ